MSSMQGRLQTPVLEPCLGHEMSPEITEPNSGSLLPGIESRPSTPGSISDTLSDESIRKVALRLIPVFGAVRINPQKGLDLAHALQISQQCFSLGAGQAKGTDAAHVIGRHQIGARHD